MKTAATTSADKPKQRNPLPRRRRAPGPNAGQFGQGRLDPAEMARRSHLARRSPAFHDFGAAMRDLAPLMKQRIHEILKSPSAKFSDVLRAVEIAAAYGFGRPVTTLEVNVQRKPRLPSELTDAEIRAFLAGGSLSSPVMVDGPNGVNVFNNEGQLLEFNPETDNESVGAMRK